MAMRLNFDNRVLRALPVDSITTNVPRQVGNACFTRVMPTPVDNPRLVAMSRSALGLVGLDGSETDFLHVMAGNAIPAGADAAAHCYCGHQFGSFAGQLGDGAAIYLGEIARDVTSQSHELQLKGAGKTPYSRTADGRKVLRSSIREFLCSEAMHGLGIPTTRAGSIVTSDTTVDRDPLYTGAVVSERCSVVSRISPTFLRFGSFEVVLEEGHNSDRAGPSPGNSALAVALFDFVATAYYGRAPADADAAPHQLSDASRKADVAAVLREVTLRTAALVAQWQAVGWVHGVLNTDNMSIIGVTIDYGPFAFMEHFDPELISNTSDDTGRYSYGNQPEMCKWNLLRLAEALAYVEPARDVRESWAEELKHLVAFEYDAALNSAIIAAFRRKLGIDGSITDTIVDQWRDRLHRCMTKTRVDYTQFFHVLERWVAGDLATAADAAAATLALCMTREQALNALRKRAFSSRPRIAPVQAQRMLVELEADPDRLAMMFGADPAALKDHLLGQLAKAEAFMALKTEATALEQTSDETYKAEVLAEWTGFFAAYADAFPTSDADARTTRVAVMRAANPRFVLRPWIAQNAIEAAERGDFTVTQQLVERLLRPFETDAADGNLFAQRPAEYTEICVSCSS